MKVSQKKRAVKSPDDAGFSLISDEKLMSLYTAMLKCRILDERLRPARAKKRVAADRGREAILVGATIDLHPKDSVGPFAAGAALGFLRGISPKTIVSRLGRRTGSAGANTGMKSHGTIPTSTDLAVQLEVALRVAQLHKQERSKKIVVLFTSCGPEWSSTAPEFLRIAAQKKLPLLFICDGAGAKNEFAPQSLDYGVPGMIVDGHDVVAVYRVVSEAMTHARRGNGPTFVECRPWIVEDSGRRRRASGDPIRNMEKYLAGKGLFSKQVKSGIVSAFKRELDNASAQEMGRKRAAKKPRAS